MEKHKSITKELEKALKKHFDNQSLHIDSVQISLRYMGLRFEVSFTIHTPYFLRGEVLMNEAHELVKEDYLF